VAALQARIFYRVPDVDHPSWGIGLLYRHVTLLRRRGFDAYALHQRHPFQLGWMDAPPPCRYLDDPALALTAEDVLVLPEALADELRGRPFPGRAVLFVQGTYPLFAAIRGRRALAQLGFDHTITILPHAAHLLERFFGVQAELVPPFVAPYFFLDPGELARPRQRRVLLHVKEAYEQAGFPDRRILEDLWHENAPRGWQLERFAGLDHRKLAARMANSAFLVNLNVLEAFNTTVPEAMAAGCIALCYGAVGGQDFLEHGRNALVFENNHVVALAERLFASLAAFDAGDAEIAALRRRARASVERYTEARTGDALDAFFRRWLD